MADRRFHVGVLLVILSSLVCCSANVSIPAVAVPPSTLFPPPLNVTASSQNVSTQQSTTTTKVENATIISTITPTESATKPSVAVTSPAPLVNLTSSTTTTTQKTDARIELTIPHNLGENGTGIRHYKDCPKTGNGTNSSFVCVSEPIVPEEGESGTVGDFNMDQFSEPQDKLLADNNITHIKQDTHDYYNSTLEDDKTIFDEFWNSIMKKDLKIHTILSTSHRFASTMQLSFNFLFYGQTVKTLTVATGGFLYTGEYVHNWLAAAQYIAPLMANFDTSLYNDSFVKYNDNGTALTVLWENVVLQDKPKYGRFTFATILYKNGDIVFAYKDIPVPVETIQDTSHPVKIGLSDALIIDNVSYMFRHKTIYEYHRVDVKNRHISNNSLIILNVLSSCPQYKTCKACVEHDSVFGCSWCSNVKRCSSGNDRLRQEWLSQNCPNTKIIDAMKCPAEDNIVINTDSGERVYPPYTTKNLTDLNTKQAVKTDASAKTAESPENGGSAGAIIAAFITVVTLGGMVTWFVYAYRNPHTSSGQLLIKYRPSQWSWRRGEARYTAATIHM